MRGYRVGIVNPRTPFGERVRELLSEQHLPVIELKLFESAIDGEATLAQFNDEVVVTQPVDGELLPHLDLVFFSGEDGELINRLAVEAAGSDVLSLVQGAVGLAAPVAAVGLGDADFASDRLIVVPRMASYLVGAVLERAKSSLGARAANATVLLPAGERGAKGAEELHQQVVSILSFKNPPTDVFGEQIAFNMNVAHAGPKAAALAEAVAAEASSLAGLEAKLTVNLVQVPVFHGYAASIWVELDEPADPKTIAAAFREAPFAIETARGGKSPSPISVAESNRIHVGSLRPSSEASKPGFWLWAVADTTAYDPALAAVDLAKTILG